jgi:hypothetical protein
MSTPYEDRRRPLPDGERVPTNPGTVVSMRGSVVDMRFDVLASFEALIGPQRARRLRIGEGQSR